MIIVKMSRKAMNKAMKGKPISIAKQETSDLNDWCAKYGVTFEIPNKEDIHAICPDTKTALLFKMTWL